MKFSGRILGVDYGEKRIGLSICDANHKLAFPHGVIPNDSETFKRLGEMIKKENISSVVIGESVDFSGKLNALSETIEVFIREITKRFKLPVHKQKEFLTTVEARRSYYEKAESSPSQAHSKLKKIKKGRVDASASALILQRYLDKMNQKYNFTSE